MKSHILLFVLLFNGIVFGQTAKDTLLLVKVECYLNDTLLESASQYAYDKKNNQTISANWDTRYKYLHNVEFVSFRTYNNENKLIKELTYTDSVLTDSSTFVYSDNSLIYAYKRSQDLDNYRVTETTYSDFEKPIKEEIVQVTFYFGQRKEKKFLNLYQYDQYNNLIEHSAYRIDDDESYARDLRIGEIDTTDYSDSLIFRTIFRYDQFNRLIAEEGYTINSVHSSTRWIHYDTLGRIFQEDSWYAYNDSTACSYKCIFSETNELSCSECEDFNWRGTFFSSCENKAGQIIEDTYDSNGFLTKRSYTYNEMGYLTMEIEATSYLDEITIRKTFYSYRSS